MTHSLRKILADSHVAAIAAAVLIVWSAYWLAFAIPWTIESSLDPIASIANYLATAVAIRGVPASPIISSPDNWDRLQLAIILGSLFKALFSFAGASILTRCVYGAGPLRALKSHLFIFRRQHV
ncbi:MAG: hypothetical protein WBQ34_00140 [Candidatus Acidiferrales bacterium]